MNESEDHESPEFWFQKTMEKFSEEIEQSPNVGAWKDAPKNRRERLALLWDYLSGNPPLPYISASYKDIFTQVMRKARTNLALLVIESMVDRSQVSSVSTKSDSDFDGDDFARAIHNVSGFDSMWGDFQTFLFTFGEAYIQIVPPAEGLDASTTPPMMTVEDPRHCVGIPNMLVPGRLRSWVKVYDDEILDQQVAILCWGNRKYYARREEGVYSDTFSMEEWEWSTEEGESEVDMSALEAFGGIPVVRIENKYGMGEFEAHIDLLDRIMDDTLQRIVIAWYQAFRQRAVSGNLDGGEDWTAEETEEARNLIRSMAGEGEELKNLFEADPGSLWLLPEGVTFWESSQADFRQMLLTIEAGVKEFASVTRTPLTMFNPDSANQTAEGALTMKEAHIDKVRNRQSRMTPGLILAHQIAFALGGEEARSTSVSVRWRSPERVSLAAKGDFMTKATGTLSRKRILADVMDYGPEEIRLNEKELMQEVMMAQTIAMPAPGAQAEATPADDTTEVDGDPQVSEDAA